jgi:hypothetical protein
MEVSASWVYSERFLRFESLAATHYAGGIALEGDGHRDADTAQAVGEFSMQLWQA